MLRRKLGQHIQSLLVAIDAAEQIGEFLDLAVLEQTNGLGAWSTTVLLPVPGVAIVPVTLVAEPVLTTLEGVGGQVELTRGPMLERTEVGQVTQHIRVGGRLGDLAVVRGVSAQGRDRTRRGRGIRPSPQSRGGEHRLRADLEQHLAVHIGKRAHTLGEFHRLPGVATPVGAVEFHAPAQRGTGPVVDQNPLRRLVVELIRVGLELVEDWVEQRRVERMRSLQEVATNAIGHQGGDGLLQILCGA
ncbi:Uncharacterised protein [Mycobacteroides abscessus subsp. massiliense]|nr:Uncharacterised protein [Mycobacteroides abscessus subsp. massiliense]SKZ64338.1 Uncharacterised protein [Mycobacteroides abscessus subsp. massiliense]